MARTFEDKPATRGRVPLLVSLIGPSGGGKTYSALRIATGIQSVFGGDIGGIDTEAERMTHYAEKFKFRHLNFQAPFGSLDYLEAVRHFVKKGVRTIVVDSMSHEHEGVGGYLMTHAAEMERMGNDNKNKFAAWIKPARERRQLIDAILHENINLICCFRAKEKLKIRPGQNPEELGWMPIAGDEFLYEQTATCLLYPGANGVPTWNPTLKGEMQMRKLPEQFMGVLNDGKQLSERHGKALAEWAKGGPAPGKAPEATTDPFPISKADLEKQGAVEATKGLEALKVWYLALSKENQAAVRPMLDSTWKPAAEKVSAAPAPQ